VLDSDWAEFGGHERNYRHAEFFTRDENWCSRPYSIDVYSPARTVVVYARSD
jgi:1,4-alpha-glucan branching enzyme